MKLRLYHGSENIIEVPEYGKGMRNNDYGRGFYCTEDIELAREWACAKNHDGYVNIYEFDMSGLNVLNLNDPKYNILNWLAILADNRTYWQNGTIAEDAKEYVKVVDKVSKGDVLCIVEAMKLMNEIESEFDGEVVEICAKNEEMVEYGKPLFKIKKECD